MDIASFAAETCFNRCPIHSISVLRHMIGWSQPGHRFHDPDLSCLYIGVIRTTLVGQNTDTARWLGVPTWIHFVSRCRL